MSKLTEKQRRLLAFLRDNGGIVDCYDKGLDPFCNDGEPDTINRCFSARLAVQRYDTSSDSGTVELLPAGRAALASKEPSHG